MATVTKGTAPVPSLATNTPDHSCQVAPGVNAGEALTAGDVCCLTADANYPFGAKWMKSNGTANTAPAKADGIAVVAASSGEAVTCMVNIELYYGVALTPGSYLYVSATAGLLDDAATTGGTVPVARVIDLTRIRFFGSPS